MFAGRRQVYRSNIVPAALDLVAHRVGNLLDVRGIQWVVRDREAQFVVAAVGTQPFERIKGDIAVGNAAEGGGRAIDVVRSARNAQGALLAARHLYQQRVVNLGVYQRQRNALDQDLVRWWRPRAGLRPHDVHLHGGVVGNGEQFDRAPLVRPNLHLCAHTAASFGLAYFRHAANGSHQVIVERRGAHDGAGRVDA